MQAWTSRPLERVYAAVVVDAINLKVRDGQVANRPIYAAIGVDLEEGQKDILGMWFGDGGGESAKFWMVVLTELRNRGVADVFFLLWDGLKVCPTVSRQGAMLAASQLQAGRRRERVERDRRVEKLAIEEASRAW